jgi:hypothetical protein
MLRHVEQYTLFVLQAVEVVDKNIIDGGVATLGLYGWAHLYFARF